MPRLMVASVRRIVEALEEVADRRQAAIEADEDLGPPGNVTDDERAEPFSLRSLAKSIKEADRVDVIRARRHA